VPGLIVGVPALALERQKVGYPLVGARIVQQQPTVLPDAIVAAEPASVALVHVDVVHAVARGKAEHLVRAICLRSPPLTERVHPGRRVRSRSTHRVQGGGTDFRVAVNVLSQQSPSELLYVADEAFQHPQVQTLADLPEGFTAVPSRPGGIALDYIRANLFDRRAMRALPATAPGPDNDLADKLEHYVI